MRIVEEDCKPAWNQIGVEVELATAPKFVVGVKGKENAALDRHTPFTAKQPLVTLKPFEAVVEPGLEIENSVVVELLVDEPIAKSAVLVEPLFA